MTEASIGHEAAREARDLFEGALGAVATEPSAATSPGARLLRGISVLWIVRDTAPLALAHLEGLGEAGRIAAEVAEVLERSGLAPEIAGGLRRSERALRAAFDVVSSEQARHRDRLEAGALDDVVPPAEPLQASAGEPRLFRLERRPLAPTLPDADEDAAGAAAPPPLGAATAPLDRPTSREGLAALRGAIRARVTGPTEPEPERAEQGSLEHVGFAPAVAELEVLRGFGRDALEDIALARTLRTPNDQEAWTDIAPFEQRLLDQLDALMSYGPPALSQIAPFLFEVPDDPDRGFAAALALGCLDGADAAGNAVLLLRQVAPEARPGFAEGLALASSPRLDPFLEDLARSEDAALGALALLALDRRARGSLPLVERALGSTDPRAQAQALAMAPRCGGRAAIPLLEAAAARSEGAPLRAALTALACLRHPDVAGPLRALARESAEDPWALELLALGGAEEDAKLVLEAFLRAPSVGSARLVGRAGHPASVEALVALLDDLEGELREATAHALFTITGAPLRHERMEPWPIELPDVVDPAAIQVPSRPVQRVETSRAAWAAWLAGDGARAFRAFAASARPPRLRLGEPLSPSTSVAEIAAPRARPEERAASLLEARLSTGAVGHVWLGDWVARQTRQIAALRDEVVGAGRAPGAWSGGSPRASSRPAPGSIARSAPSAGATPPASGAPPPPAMPSFPATPPFAAPRPFAAPSSAAPPGAGPPSAEPSGAGPSSAGPSSAEPSGAEPSSAGPSSAGPTAVAPSAPAGLARPPSSAPSAPAPTQPARRVERTLVGSWGPPPPESVLPFRRSDPPPVEDGEELRRRYPLGLYAATCAEVAAHPERAATIFEKYGLGDAEVRRRVDHAYKTALARDPELRRSFDVLYARARSALG